MKVVAPKPMAHQLVSLAHDASTPLVFDASDPGTGKTFVRIVAFAKRRRAGGGCLLVVCPKNLMFSVWRDDFKKFAPDMVVSVAPAEKREKAFAVKADVYVANTDAAVWLAKQPKAFFARFSELAVDESTAFKHPTSARSKAMAKVARALGKFTHIAVMTATPNSLSITDVWHQVYLLDGGKRLGSSFYKFRAAVCTSEQATRNNPHALKWIDKEGAEEAVFGLLQDIVIRHRFADCVDIPATHQYTVSYELPPRHRKVYDTLEQQQLIVLGSGRSKITAINAAAVSNKLQQTASGAVYTDTGAYAVVDTGRYALILDLVEQRHHSLVYFLWHHQREELIAEAARRGIPYCVLDGDTPQRAREAMIKMYQAGVYRAMFAHPKSAAHGLTLTRGTTTIWSSPTPDLELYTQGNRRQARIGQTEKTEVIVVLAENTQDGRIYHGILAPKNKRMSNLLELFASIQPLQLAA